MRTGLLFFIFLRCTIYSFSQDKLYIHRKDRTTLGVPVSLIDSIYFNHTASVINFSINGLTDNHHVSDIDSLVFGRNSDTVDIHFSGSEVSVLNPLAYEGVNISVNGCQVTVTSVISGIQVNYRLSGSTTDGMFRIFSNYKSGIELNGANITNPSGPAINIQSNKKCTVTLTAGTTNSLTDGMNYASSDEDRKGTLFSEGQLVFTGSGTLSVKSISNHAVCSDDHIEIEDGNITVAGAGKDGIHASDYFRMSGGSLNISATGDGIDCEKGYIDIPGGNITLVCPSDDVNGMVSDSTMTISGGSLHITVSGLRSKGVKAGRQMTLGGGTIQVEASGGVYLQRSGAGYDPAYCCAIKSGGNISIAGSNITIHSTGIAGKGISGDHAITLTSGSVNISCTGNGNTYTNSSGVVDSYNATCLTADGNISIPGGTLALTASGTGGKGITLNGILKIGDSGNSPSVNITTSGTKFRESGSGQNIEYNEPKAIRSDGEVEISNGNIVISSNDDAIKSKTSVTFSNAKVTISKCVEGIEAPNITVNSGEISLTGTNDGFNATKGTGSEANDGSLLTFNGGYVVTNISSGDGLDSNGNMIMTGGTVLVHGPQSQPEVGMDFNGSFLISGGLLVVSGTNSNMTEGPGTSSQQYSVIAKTTTANSSLFHAEDAGGNNIITFKPVRTYYSMIFSSPLLKSGGTCKIYTGGSSTGVLKDGMYTGGTYSGGTLKKSFSITGKVTIVTF